MKLKYHAYYEINSQKNTIVFTLHRHSSSVSCVEDGTTLRMAHTDYTQWAIKNETRHVYFCDNSGKY